MRGLVRASAGLSFPGMYDIWIEPSAFQSEMAKYGIAICRERSVGATASMIFFVDWLSSHAIVGLSCGKFRLCRMKHRYLTILAAETTA